VFVWRFAPNKHTTPITIGYPEEPVKQTILHIALVVRDYDEAIAFYTQKLHFTLVEDTYQPEQDKRWVVVSPPGSSGTTLLLAKASKPEQLAFVGNQTGGRVFLFLNSDNFWRDYTEMVANGIHFIRPPKEEPYGLVAVFEDLYGNLWDLLQINAHHPLYAPASPETLP
jgi:catechol 2,3-dioxygenase-like lactoylglutathione lyase family enzyme